MLQSSLAGSSQSKIVNGNWIGLCTIRQRLLCYSRFIASFPCHLASRLHKVGILWLKLLVKRCRQKFAPFFSLVVCLVDEDGWPGTWVIGAISTWRADRGWGSSVSTIHVSRVVRRESSWSKVVTRLVLPWILAIHVVPRLFEWIHLLFDLLLTCKEIVRLDQVATWKWGSRLMWWNLIKHVGCRLWYLNLSLLISASYWRLLFVPCGWWRPCLGRPS